MISPNKVDSFSSYGAYYYIHSGEAYNSYFLCIGDLSTDPNAQQNVSFAKWYEKEAVYIVVGEEFE